MRAILAAAYALLVGASLVPAPLRATGPGGPRMIPTHYIMFYEQQLSGTFQANVDPEGTTAWVTCNFRGRQEIGTYRGLTGAETFERLRALKAATDLNALRARPEDVPPDGAVTGIGETTDAGAHMDLWSWPRGSVPPAAQQLLAAALRIAEPALGHPMRVLSAQAAPVTPTIAGEPLRFAVALRSTGTEPVRFANPLEPASGRASARILLARDLPEAKRTDADLATVELASRNLTLADGKGRTPKGEWVTLAPGDALRLEVRRPFHAKPGRHRARLDLGFSDAGDAGALEGTLSVDLGVVEIARGAR